MATVVFGESQPGLTAVVPFYGYKPDQVATPIAMVCTGAISGVPQYSLFF